MGQQIFVGCLLAGIVVAVIEASSTFDERCGWSLFNDLAITVSSNDQDRFEIRQGSCRLVVKLDGEVAFTDDESGIESLGPGARLTIDERDREGRRHLEVRRGEGGGPVYAWTVDGEKLDFDASGQNWLQDLLPRIFRLTGVDADRRVARILRRQGVAGVLDEVELVRGDRLQRLYLDELLSQAALTTDELASTLQTAGGVLGTDHELRQWLSRITAGQLTAPDALRAYSEAVASIGTDQEMRLALSALLRSDGLELRALEMLLAASTGIGTDHQLAELLIDVATSWPEDRMLPRELAVAVETLGTDHEQHRVLAAAFKRPGISGDEIDFLLRTASLIGTDHELAELLVGLTVTYPQGRALPSSFFAALDSVGTDFEHRRVLSAVVARSELSPPAIAGVLDSALSIGTDHELATLLVELVATHGVDSELEPALERALATLGASERRRVEQALGRVEQVHS